MGSLRSIHSGRDGDQRHEPHLFFNPKPALPDISEAEARLRSYALELPRFRIIAALEITDLDTCSVFYELKSVAFTSKGNIEHRLDLSESDIQSVIEDLVCEGIIEYVDEVDPDDPERHHCASLGTKSRVLGFHLLRELSHSEDGISAQELACYEGVSRHIRLGNSGRTPAVGSRCR